MPIALDATSAPSTTTWQAGLSAQSWSHTCSGSDRCLLVAVAVYHSAARTVSGITYNGVALTKIGGITAALESNQQDCELWYLANPASGTNTITVTLSAAANFWAPLAVSYTGVDTAAAIDASNTGQNTSNSTNAPTVSVTTVADNDWLVGVAWSRASAPTASTGTTNRISNTGTWVALSDSNGGKSPAGAYNLAWTSSNGTWPGVITAALKPVGGSSTFTATLTATQAQAASRTAAVQALKSLSQASTTSRLAAVSTTRTATQSSTSSLVKAVSAIKSLTQSSTATLLASRLFLKILTATQSAAGNVTSSVIPAGTLIFNWIVHWTRRGRRKR